MCRKKSEEQILIATHKSTRNSRNFKSLYSWQKFAEVKAGLSVKETEVTQQRCPSSFAVLTTRADYLSTRLLRHAMRILLVNEFMRRPECTVKSNITRHSWHTASPPRKTSRRSTGSGYDTPRTHAEIFPPSGKRDIPSRFIAFRRYCTPLVYHFYANNPPGVFLRIRLVRRRDYVTRINFTQSIYRISFHAAF